MTSRKKGENQRVDRGTEPDRRVLHLHDAGWSIGRIAKKLGWKPERVRYHLRLRGRDKAAGADDFAAPLTPDRVEKLRYLIRRELRDIRCPKCGVDGFCRSSAKLAPRCRKCDVRMEFVE